MVTLTVFAVASASDDAHVLVRAGVEAHHGHDASPPIAERFSPEEALTAYLLDAAEDWVPMRAHVWAGETEEQAHARIGRLARAIAVVALDPAEPPLYAPPHARGKTAMLLLAQAAIESGFAAWVEDGRCNDARWRASAEGKRLMHGDCDYAMTPSGAWSPWQIHVDEQGGVILEGTGWLAANRRKGAPAIHGPDVIRDRVTASRVALHWKRATPTAWGSDGHARGKAWAWTRAHAFDASVP